MNTYIKTLLFITTGMIQMLLVRWLGVHDGLEHMVFNYWWEYVVEGLFYSLTHLIIYHISKSGHSDENNIDKYWH
jgi:hypothetical protein